jgi:hypothetical protein
MPQDSERIKKDLLESMKYYDRLRVRLVYNPVKEEVKQFMQENDLQEEWQIERCIEELEDSEVCKAADELNMSTIDLNIWICESK